MVHHVLVRKEHHQHPFGFMVEMLVVWGPRRLTRPFSPFLTCSCRSIALPSFLGFRLFSGYLTRNIDLLNVSHDTSVRFIRCIFFRLRALAGSFEPNDLVFFLGAFFIRFWPIS